MVRFNQKVDLRKRKHIIKLDILKTALGSENEHDGQMTITVKKVLFNGLNAFTIAGLVLF